MAVIEIGTVEDGVFSFTAECYYAATTYLGIADQQIIAGPAHIADGSANLIGALRRAMATTGYSELKGFQRVGLVHAER